MDFHRPPRIESFTPMQPGKVGHDKAQATITDMKDGKENG